MITTLNLVYLPSTSTKVDTISLYAPGSRHDRALLYGLLPLNCFCFHHWSSIASTGFLSWFI